MTRLRGLQGATKRAATKRAADPPTSASRQEARVARLSNLEHMSDLAGKLQPVVVLYRQLIDRSSRREQSTAITHSGLSRTVFSCVCGSRHTCSTRHRDAKHVSDWRIQHAGCMRQAVQVMLDKLRAVASGAAK